MLVRRNFANFAIVQHFILSVLVTFGAGPNAFADCEVDYAGLIRQAEQKGFEYGKEVIRFGEAVALESPASAGGRKFIGTFERISELEEAVRVPLKALRGQTRAGTSKEREMGMMIAVYKDGTHRTITFTSNDRYQIAPWALEAALKKHKIINDQLVSIFDVHTHPDLGKRSDLLFSPEDIDGFLYWKKTLQKAVGRDIDYQSMLLPGCKDCDDVVLTSEF